ncbi:chemotaxis protein CheW [Carboxylicivirga mesophila]|uniref:Chemotaxis protein CheW n=2 Tax=Carboxylicivirga TaxID=1628153 RepID=A0A941F7E4_9BACT|nr:MULTISPECIES: chemotaxis protein CheW [Carboxylicivirga]MBR8537049.1 chemotaxis protein CheW [Carboxylicivirga sediminis]MBS2213034.1 chemotaxis protein CheW [Carboxylicivirga mesophila]
MSQEVNAYLTFAVGNNIFGVHVEKVVEIKEYAAPKSVPESMSYVKGVADHREQIIPIIDAAAKFNLGEINITPQSCIVVLEIDKADGSGMMSIGVLVDAVSDVFETDESKLKAIETDYKPGYISASYQNGDDLVMILNADKIFSEKDIINLGEVVKAVK